MDLVQAFATLDQREVQAVIVPNTSLLNPLSAQIATLAVTHRLPSIGSPILARAGGMLDLPMEGPAKFDLTVNVKTAKALGLTIPRSVLQQADQVIE